jgi:hypothetical protein
MRRALLAATLGGVLLTGTACDSDARTTAGASVGPSTASSAPPNYWADTRKVCGKLELIYDKDLESFGTQLGKMIAYKEAKVPAEAKKSKAAAAKQLKTVAAKVRKETSTAADPALTSAGSASAASISKTADDSAFFDKIKSTKDLDKVIESQMTTWFTPVAGYCA